MIIALFHYHIRKFLVLSLHLKCAYTQRFRLIDLERHLDRGWITLSGLAKFSEYDGGGSFGMRNFESLVGDSCHSLEDRIFDVKIFPLWDKFCDFVKDEFVFLIFHQYIYLSK